MVITKRQSPLDPFGFCISSKACLSLTKNLCMGAHKLLKGGLTNFVILSFVPTSINAHMIAHSLFDRIPKDAPFCCPVDCRSSMEMMELV